MANHYVTPIANAIRRLDNFKYPLDYYMFYGWDGLKDYGFNRYINSNGDYVEFTSSEFYAFEDLKRIVTSNTTFNNDCN
jgi:hypothetical protein